MILEEYLKKHHFNKYFEKLTKKLKNKRAIVYGTGSMFEFIKENYDLTLLNIIGISDSKYKRNDEGKEYLGYKIIPIDKIEDYEFDVLIISIQEYFKALKRFSYTCPGSMAGTSASSDPFLSF